MSHPFDTRFSASDHRGGPSFPPAWRNDPRWAALEAQRRAMEVRRPESGSDRRPPRPEDYRPRTRWKLAIGLFVASCLSTLLVGGPVYAAAVMTILFCHEMGHYLQARRYGVPASLPYFLPMPLNPLGTMGAVIAMQPRATHAKGLFDLAISGPLAGLVPTLIFTWVGLKNGSSIVPNIDLPEGPSLHFGEPLLFQWLSQWILGPIPPDHTLVIGPLAFAGWVGVFITALNLLPVGQLDGGHILYALAPKLAPRVSLWLVAAAVVAVITQGLWTWSLMLLLLILVGLRHPPIEPGGEPIGPGRKLLGWLTLAFLLLGMVPEPFIFSDVP